jgi:predicted ATPase/class 3 adenylate cyclase
MLPPTGNVTLVFTDLRASSVLWSELGVLMREALTLHDKVMRECLRKHRGYEVKSEGGSFMLAFDQASDALAWCCDAQMRLLVAPWSPALLDHDVAGEVRSDDGHLIYAGLRVTMGLHSGEPDCRIDPTTGRMDYFGPVTNRAARIAAAAHEGQVLFSRSVWAECEDADKDGFDDLGSHRLRGLEGRVHIYSVLPSGLSGRRFPPPLTLDAIRTNLSDRGDRFIGRAEAIEAIEASFGQGHRLVTVMGASGLGKTRLAQRFGALRLQDYPGGVWFCDLADAKSLSELATQVGHTLSIPLTSGSSDSELLNQIGAALAAKDKALLIVDNLEQIIEDAANAVEVWLDAAIELNILATSQERLRLSVESVHELPPLAKREAVELFEARAREVRGSYQPSLVERAAVADIVAALDHVPLAIELAAAQVHRMSAKSLSGQLQKRLDLLTNSDVDVPKRQRSLRAAIEWSWELIGPFEQEALAQASVFRGGFSLESAEQVIVPVDEQGPWVMDLLESLADKSFILTQASGVDQSDLRFFMFESIRLFAAEALKKSGQSEVCLGRHAAHFSAQAEVWTQGLYRQDGVQMRRHLIDERQNLQALIAWPGATAEQRGHATLAQVSLLKVSGPLSARLPLIQAIDDSFAEMSPGLRGLLLRARAECEADSGEIRAALVTLGSALKTAKEAGDPQLEGRVLGTLGLLQRNRGDISAARQSYQQALACARRCGDDPTRGAMLNNLAGLEHDQARFSEAETLFLEALELALSRQQALGAATAQLNLGTISAERGDLRRAHHFYAQALSTFEEHGDSSYSSTVIALIGMVELDEGLAGRAKKRFSEVLKHAVVSGDLVAQVMSECWHGVAHWLESEEEAAFLRFRAAAGLMSQLSSPKHLAFTHAYYGAMLAQRGRIGEAREQFRLARYLMRESGNRNHLDSLKVLVGVAAVSLAQAAYKAGDEQSFARHLSIAIARRNYAQTPTPESEQFPEGLPSPIQRSCDARLCLKLLDRCLSKLPNIPDDLAQQLKPEEAPRDTLPPGLTSDDC